MKKIKLIFITVFILLINIAPSYAETYPNIENEINENINQYPYYINFIHSNGTERYLIMTDSNDIYINESVNTLKFSGNAKLYYATEQMTEYNNYLNKSYNTYEGSISIQEIYYNNVIIYADENKSNVYKDITLYAENVDPPDEPTQPQTGFWITDILVSIKDAFVLSVGALNEFYNMLVSQEQEILTLSNTIETGTVEGLDILSFIATFRWIVGDIIFHVFYSLIIIGLLYTIYAIVTIIKSEIPIGSAFSKVKGFFFK